MNQLPFANYWIHRDSPNTLNVYLIPANLEDHVFLGKALEEGAKVASHLGTLRQARGLPNDDNAPLDSGDGITVGCVLKSSGMVLCCALVDVCLVGQTRLRQQWFPIVCELVRRRSAGQYVYGETLQ